MARKEAEDFFYKHAGWGYDPKKETQAQGRRRGARLLAKAEVIAQELGWTYRWEDDPEEWQGDEDRPDEVLMVALLDEEGGALESLGGIGMSGNYAQDRRYGRVVEAELALEAATRKGLI